ncbi:hypothetical protein ES288_A11G012100v1, partial [Gossypium darwinii]
KIKTDGSRGIGAESALSPNYILGKTTGIGSFGIAIKNLDLTKIKTKAMEEKVRREINISRLFMHPHIIRLYEVIETTTDIFMVTEYAESGELFDYIVLKRRLHEDEARKLFQQNMVVHRDLKPENLLQDSNYNVKIADFGLSNVMQKGHLLKTCCGSPNYAAPEVGVFCGVISYALLCGTLPFEDDNFPNLYKKIKAGVYTIPSHLSSGARDLIARILVVDPTKRLTIPEIRQHPWFQPYLPRYLAVFPPDTTQQAQKIDDDIFQHVVRMGFERNHLVESLCNRVQNEGTVVYHLLLDNRFGLSSDYLGGAEFQAILFQIMMEVLLKALRAIHVHWENIRNYNIKWETTMVTLKHRSPS